MLQWPLKETPLPSWRQQWCQSVKFFISLQKRLLFPGLLVFSFSRLELWNERSWNYCRCFTCVCLLFYFHRGNMVFVLMMIPSKSETKLMNHLKRLTWFLWKPGLRQKTQFWTSFQKTVTWIDSEKGNRVFIWGHFMPPPPPHGAKIKPALDRVLNRSYMMWLSTVLQFQVFREIEFPRQTFSASHSRTEENDGFHRADTRAGLFLHDGHVQRGPCGVSVCLFSIHVCFLFFLYSSSFDIPLNF